LAAAAAGIGISPVFRICIKYLATRSLLSLSSIQLHRSVTMGFFFFFLVWVSLTLSFLAETREAGVVVLLAFGNTQEIDKTEQTGTNDDTRLASELHNAVVASGGSHA
jgi:hypothetical protein